LLESLLLRAAFAAGMRSFDAGDAILFQLKSLGEPQAETVARRLRISVQAVRQRLERLSRRAMAPTLYLFSPKMVCQHPHVAKAQRQSATKAGIVRCRRIPNQYKSRSVRVGYPSVRGIKRGKRPRNGSALYALARRCSK
jgi:hypothetical protein